jgi:hypothetical protein
MKIILDVVEPDFDVPTSITVRITLFSSGMRNLEFPPIPDAVARLVVKDVRIEKEPDEF